MKILITYASQTGNTKKLADAASQILHGEKTICPVDEAPEPAGFDLVILGFWLQGGKPDPKSSGYLAKIGDARLFLFATHGARTDSPHAINAMDNARSLAPSARVSGTFNCQGTVNPSFLEKARQKNPLPAWIEDAPAAVGHPDAVDIDRLKAAIKSALPEFTS